MSQRLDTYIKILEYLHSQNSDCYCPNYENIQFGLEFNISLVGLKKVIKNLKLLGYVEVVHGLINDDGEVCGSGFQIKNNKMAEVRDMVHNYRDRQDRDPVFYGGKELIITPEPFDNAFSGSDWNRWASQITGFINGQII